MTRQQLEQIYCTAKELRMWERELERLKARSPVSSPLPRNGSGSGISDPTAQKTEHVITLENKIAEFREKLQSERDEAVRFIMTIPDSITRMVVYYRCVSLMSWRQAAREIGGNNSEENLRQIYSRFMKNLSPKSQTGVV